MRRVVVAGAFGFFGRAALERLRADGLQPLAASRQARGDLQLDVEDPASIRRALRSGDVVIDAAGPFQLRTMTLVETAIEVGFDLVDLSDSLDYAPAVAARAARFETAGIAVLTSCSSTSAITAALTRLSGIVEPESLSVFLAPATRETANAGTSRSLLHSLGRPIRVWRDGRLVADVGWRASRAFDFPQPVGRVCGYLMETVDAILLPRVWPSLREVSFWVDSRSALLNSLFALAARHRTVRFFVSALAGAGRTIARRLGATSGGLAVDVAARRLRAGYAITAGRRSYLSAVAPAVLAARALAEDRFGRRGFVAPDAYVDSDELVAYLRALGMVCGPINVEHRNERL